MAPWEQLLEEVVRTRRAALLGYASLFALDRSDAEDLVQDALVRVFARARSFPDARTAEAYVKQAIRTSFLDRHRRRTGWLARVHLVVERDAVRGADESAVAGVDVRAALAALPPRQRACVVLRHLDDLSVGEVAAELGLSEGAVKRYLFDAARTLRAVLGDNVVLGDDVHGVPVRSVDGRP